jgi:hypothetical protein
MERLKSNGSLVLNGLLLLVLAGLLLTYPDRPEGTPPTRYVTAPAALRDSVRHLRQLAEAHLYLLEGNRPAADSLYETLPAPLVQAAARPARAAHDAQQRTLQTLTARLNAAVAQAARATDQEAERDRLTALDSVLQSTQRALNVNRRHVDSLRRVHAQEKREIVSAMERHRSSATWQFITFKNSRGSEVRYVGEVVGNKANGYGIGIFESGSVYQGYWKNNARHGSGKFDWADGERYEGEYHQDLRQGFGVYRWKNGLRYEGDWLADMRTGEGILYDKNDRVRYEGTWTNDKPDKK